MGTLRPRRSGVQIQWLCGVRTAVGGILIAAGVHAQVSAPSIFGDHMVLQRGRPVPVWGRAAPGEKVTVQLDADTRSVTADASGDWRADLAPHAVGTGLTLTIRGKNSVLEYSDVAVGEVWLCSGQSNMEMGIQRVLNAEKEIAAATDPDLRLIDVPKVLAATPQRDFKGTWVRCTPETVASHGTWGGFSACAYFFGRKLRKELAVPVGLIDSSWGGSRIEPWTPPVGFGSVPSLADIVRRIDLSSPNSDAHRHLARETLDKFQAWLDSAKKAMAAGTPCPPQPPFPKELLPLQGWSDPCAMYNAMIHPLVPYALRGAIWYQGESNRGDGVRYVDKTRALVQGWRALWKAPDMPYYYVQIAPYQYGSEDPTVLARFWAAQAQIEKSIPHTGMAVINDIGNLKDIHPKNKQEAGRRLALLALAETYGKKDIVCRGPLFRAMKIEGKTVRTEFDNADGGLATRDGKKPNWFEILGDNGRFVKADAVLDGESVVLSAPGITTPYAVRFAWDKLAVPNLVNRAGLPAAAFRAGHVPIRAELDACVPEAKDYRIVYGLDGPSVRYADGKVVYDTDRSNEIQGPFKRIAYFLSLHPKTGKNQYVFVAMDPFTRDIHKIGVPAFALHARFQQKVSGMLVRSNVPGVTTGTGIEGFIEFWASNYGPRNTAKVPGASDAKFDFGDEQHPEVAQGYGCMQVHNPGAKQTVFAYNHWTAGAKADMGIGNSPTGNPDWTFRTNAGAYADTRLLVLVLPEKAR